MDGTDERNPFLFSNARSIGTATAYVQDMDALDTMRLEARFSASDTATTQSATAVAATSSFTIWFSSTCEKGAA